MNRSGRRSTDGEGPRQRRFRGPGISLALAGSLLLLLWAGAGSALATATATKAKWYAGPTESSVSELSGEQTLTAALIENPTIGKHFRMTAVFAPLTLTIEAGGVSCSKCVMSNEIHGVTGPGAIWQGRLVFSEAVVTSPANCQVTGGAITTNPLFFEADFMEGEGWRMRLYPEVGENAFNFSLENKGGTCGLAHTFTVQNVNFGAFANATGTFRTEQRLDFSPAISKAAAEQDWFFKGTGHPLETTGSLVLKAGGNYFGAK
jgi:hypothetical protein